MDPYLERPNLWHGVHNRLIAAIADSLSPLLRPRYFVAVEERSYLADPLAIGFTTIPDVSVVGAHVLQPQPTSVRQAAVMTTSPEPLVIDLPMPEPIRETYLEIQEVGSNGETDLWMQSGDENLKVVTLLEILSPWNKTSRAGRVQYQRKRQEVLNSYTNLVEIDLLRAGQSIAPLPPENNHYSILVSPARMRPRAELYPFSIRQAIPSFRLPLQPDDDWPMMDLNALLHDLYERAAYDLRIDYRLSPPSPAFSQEDAQWLDSLLREAGVR
jgi:hypothetical protein